MTSVSVSSRSANPPAPPTVWGANASASFLHGSPSNHGGPVCRSFIAASFGSCLPDKDQTGNGVGNVRNSVGEIRNVLR